MPKPQSLEILYSDGHYVAVAKPAALAVIPGRGETTSLLEQLAAQLALPHAGQADPRLRVVHRIDKDTSGIVVFATDREAQRHLSEQYQNCRVEKQYLALVAGQPEADEGDIDAPLAPHPASPGRMVVSKHGRPARTLWRVEARLGPYALLRLFPRTGKTHQIRVHLQSIGLPLAIDPLYNPRSPASRTGLFLSSFKRGYRAAGDEERPLIQRLTLHAERLRFESLDGLGVEVVCPPPKDLRAAISMLRKYGR